MDQIGIKLFCTLGPTSLNYNVLHRMEDLGVDVFRLNLSHTKIEDLESLIELVQSTTSVPLCIDSEGAQIRTGTFKENTVEIESGSSVILTRENIEGTEEEFTLVPEVVFDNLEPGSMLSVDFNAVLLLITEAHPTWAKARVLSGGLIGSNKGVTANHDIPLPSMSPKDQQAIQLAKKHGINHFALSFANSEEAVLSLRELAGPETTIISKVETQAAMNNLDGIIRASDAILIDRGDLSREIPIENIPYLQQRIINKAHQKPIPIYVATNLLESMVSSPYPTRAEISDITSTLLNGANGLVLAAETAIGQYPVKCVAMIKRLSNHFLSETWPDIHMGNYWLGNGMFPNTIMPHGQNTAVSQLGSHKSDRSMTDYPSMQISPAVVRDIEQIDSGVYSPLSGFMNRDDIHSVLDHNTLSDRTIWTLPIVLQSDRKSIPASIGGEMLLICECCDVNIAMIKIQDIYEFDHSQLCQAWFNSVNPNHPGVARLHQNGNCFIGGEIKLLQKHPATNNEYNLTPAQIRATFSHNGWERVVGYHTRDTPHRAHEYIQMKALDRSAADGLFINPALGQKKNGDFSESAIISSYESLIRTHYDKTKVVLSGFFGNSWYSGPREAVFTALCRKNFGCSHFVVGRDHTGVGDFYKPGEVEDLFMKLGDIGIEPLFFDEVVYDSREKNYREIRPSEDLTSVNRISGTAIRQHLVSGTAPPEWMMRPEVSKTLLEMASKDDRLFEP